MVNFQICNTWIIVDFQKKDYLYFKNKRYKSSEFNCTSHIHVFLSPNMYSYHLQFLNKLIGYCKKNRGPRVIIHCLNNGDKAYHKNFKNKVRAILSTSNYSDISAKDIKIYGERYFTYKEYTFGIYMNHNLNEFIIQYNGEVITITVNDANNVI